MMKLGSDVVVMLSSAGKQKGYRVGDSVGPFKFSAIKDEELTFEWNGQVFTKTLAELKKLTPAAPVAGEKAGNLPPGVVASTPTSITTIGAGGQEVVTNVTPIEKYREGLKLPSGPGVAGGSATERLCDPNDKSPNGTMQDGFRKRLIPSPMGNNCIWELVR